MIAQDKEIRGETLTYLDAAGVKLRPDEVDAMTVADFGLGRIREVGIQVIVYVNTDGYCAKELVLLPRQTCPEHRHPAFGDHAGKAETFRCRFGNVYVYVEGEPTPKIGALIPAWHSQHLTVRREVVLQPGDQYSISPNTKHWFQAGDLGAVITEWSTTSFDEHDIFSDPAIQSRPRGNPPSPLAAGLDDVLGAGDVLSEPAG